MNRIGKVVKYVYTKMTRIKTGAAGIAYLMQEEAHDKSGVRNQYVTPVNLVPGVSYYKQFQEYWDRADDRHETQMRHCIISFSDREFNPDNPADIARAHELVTDYVKETFPNRQIIIATQIDGKSHLLHSHAMISDVEMDTLKGFAENERTFGFLKETANQYMQEHGVKLDAGRSKDVVKYSQYERIYEQKVAETEAKKQAIRDKIEAAKSAHDLAKVSKLEEKLDSIRSPYVWKDHLKQRIEEAKEMSTSYDDFKINLAVKGVNYDDTGTHNKYWLQEDEYHKFTDNEYPPSKHVCRGKTLNPEFAKDSLEDFFASKDKEDVIAVAPPAPVIEDTPDYTVDDTAEDVVEEVFEPATEQVQNIEPETSFISDIAEKFEEESDDVPEEVFDDFDSSVKLEEIKEEDSDEELDEKMRQMILKTIALGESIGDDEDEDEDEESWSKQ